MTDNQTAASSDLSYLRTLAESGKEAPLTAGPYLIAGGGWFAAASLTQWPVLRNLLGLDAQQAMMAWLAAAAGFAIHLIVLIRQDRTRSENSSNRAVNSVWTGIGFAIMAFWIGVAIMSYRQEDPSLMNSISLHVLSLYSVGWAVAAAMTRQGWMKVNALMALITVPVLGAFVGTGHEYLIYAIALILTAVVPGVRLMAASQVARQTQLGA
jgi:hypothetical protein